MRHSGTVESSRDRTGLLSEQLDMLVCMRTTINLPDGLGEEAKRRAAQQGRTFTSMVEEGLRAVLAQQPPAPAVTLPSFGKRGTKALIDIDDRDALWAALDSR